MQSWKSNANAWIPSLLDGMIPSDPISLVWYPVYPLCPRAPFLVIHHFAKIFNCMLLLFLSSIDINAMSREQSFISYEQKALVNHLIFTKLTSSMIHCALLCMKNLACKTINYKSEHGKDEGQCELNDATADDFPLHVIHSSHSTYSVPYNAVHLVTSNL